MQRTNNTSKEWRHHALCSSTLSPLWNQMLHAYGKYWSSVHPVIPGLIQFLLGHLAGCLLNSPFQLQTAINVISSFRWTKTRFSWNFYPLIVSLPLVTFKVNSFPLPCAFLETIKSVTFFISFLFYLSFISVEFFLALCPYSRYELTLPALISSNFISMSLSFSVNLLINILNQTQVSIKLTLINDIVTIMSQTAQDLPNQIIAQLNPPPAEEDVIGNSDAHLAKIQMHHVYNIPGIYQLNTSLKKKKWCLIAWPDHSELTLDLSGQLFLFSGSVL